MLFVSRFRFGGRVAPAYSRRAPVILINGLAEQAESWYCNLDAWRRHFDVYTPQLLAYEGAGLHRRIAAGRPVDIDYLVERLHEYLDGFVQSPPYHLIANSMGGKVAVEFAARYPDEVARLVLLCPSGLSDVERLPVIDGVRRNDARSLVSSVFQDPSHTDPKLLAYYEKQFANRRWRSGLVRTIRGTMDHRVRDRLAQVTQPTLLVVGSEDRIVDPRQAIEAAGLLSRGKLVVLQGCGHAPQIEQADVINRLVVGFLQEGPQDLPKTSVAGTTAP
jgi:pimeloyl-ACP methyl ester carboxylesterase